MADKIKGKPVEKPKLTLKELVAAEPDKRVRASIKAQAIATEQVTPFVKRTLDIRLITQPEYDEATNTVKVNIEVRKDGRVLPFSNPLYIFNPPILVPTGRVKETIYDAEIDKNTDIPEMEENPKEALMEHITQVVESQIRKGKL